MKISPQILTALLLGALAWPARSGEFVFENARVRAVLGEDAVWRSLVDKGSGKDYCAVARIPCAAVKFGTIATRGAGSDGQIFDMQAAMACSDAVPERHPAIRASFADGRLTLGFADCDTVLTLATSNDPDWILFRLTGVSGTRPAELTLLRLGTTLTQHVGTRLGMGWNYTFAIGLHGANMQTCVQATRRKEFAELFATTQDAPGPKLEGAAVALVAAPIAEIDAVLQRFSAAVGLPRNEKNGVPAKQLPVARQSYWFLGFGEREVDRVIDCCRQSGFRQVMLASYAWCTKPGHYVFNKANYPDGVASLQRTVAKLHAAGILAGLHCFVSKVSKTDAYVSPVPDRRFWVDRTTTLAAGISATSTVVRTTSDLREWPGSPIAGQTEWEGGATKHQEVIVDDEIIAFDRIGPAGQWDTFLGCQRGAWETVPAAHAAGTAGRHYGVDGCINGYIIDLDTPLLDEVATRLATIYNTCDFDMVYFDGGEDVDHRRFNYCVSKFQAAAMSKFTKRPLIHMGTILTHHLWHSFTRSATVDTYLNTLHGAIRAGAKVGQWPTVKQHIDRSVQYLQSVGEDRMPGELGWFGIWPVEKNSDGLQLDEIEYLMAKSLAYNAPISLQTSFGQMAAHPLTPGILEIVRSYEELRLSGVVPAIERERLRVPQRDFLLLRDCGAPVFVEVTAAEVAGNHDTRAMVGARGHDVVLAVWHCTGQKGTLTIADAPVGALALDVFGKPITAAHTDNGEWKIPLGPRRVTLVLPNCTVQSMQHLLGNARFVPPQL